MSDKLHTLKEINLDAARYRWLRNHNMVISFYDENFECRDGMWGGLDGEQLDSMIDMELALDN